MKKFLKTVFNNIPVSITTPLLMITVLIITGLFSYAIGYVLVKCGLIPIDNIFISENFVDIMFIGLLAFSLGIVLTKLFIKVFYFFKLCHKISKFPENWKELNFKNPDEYILWLDEHITITDKLGRHTLNELPEEAKTFFDFYKEKLKGSALEKASFSTDFNYCRLYENTMY